MCYLVDVHVGKKIKMPYLRILEGKIPIIVELLHKSYLSFYVKNNQAKICLESLEKNRL